MHPLLTQLQPLVAAEDIEGITALLEEWQPRDDVWLQCAQGRIFAPSSSASQRKRLTVLVERFKADGPAASDAGASRPAQDGPTGPNREAATSLPEFLAGPWGERLQLGPPASDDELDALQAMAPMPFSDSLRAFYRTVGRIEGTIGDDGMEIRLRSPRDLLDASRSTERWRTLGGLSLLDMARVAWGNDKPDLDAGMLPPDVERAARETLCIGWLSDGYAEQHGYLVQRTDGTFQVHPWHQDDEFSAPSVAARHAADLWTLLRTVMRHMHGSTETGGVDDLSALLHALENDEH